VSFLLEQGDGAWVRNAVGAPRMDLSSPELVLGYCDPSVLAAAQLALTTLGYTPSESEGQSQAESLLVQRTAFERAQLFSSGDQAMHFAVQAALAQNPGEFRELRGGQAIDIPADCTVICVSMLGERLAPEGWLAQVSEQAKSALLICDERQTGLGRSGKLFSYQHEHLAPDFVVLGAGLGGGVVNAGAVLGPAWLPKGPGVGHLVGVCVLAAWAAILEQLPGSLRTGRHLFMALSKLPGSLVSELDALGLMAVLSLSSDLGGAQRVATKLREAGLMVHPCGANELLICAPLSISTDELDWAVGHLHAVIWT
jgi:acetylornithine/succinyldiaminopimelate/putrescine aminotransferase